MTGGVSHVDTFDPKPKLIRRPRQDHHRRLTGRASRASSSAILKKPQWDVQARRQVRHRGQRPVPARRAVRGRHLRDPLDGVGPYEPLRGHARHAHRVVHVRPAEHRRLGELRPGHGEPQSAVVHGHGAGRALRRHADLGVRLPARLPPGHARHARPHAHRQRRPPRRLRRLQQLELRPACTSATPSTSNAASGRRRALDARIRSFETAFGMQQRGAGSVRPVEGDRRDAASSTACNAGPTPASAGSAWWPGGWPSAASASSN